MPPRSGATAGSASFGTGLQLGNNGLLLLNNGLLLRESLLCAGNRRLASDVGDTDVRARLEQQIDNLRMAMFRCRHERGIAVFTGLVEFDAGLRQQEFDRVCVSFVAET